MRGGSNIISGIHHLKQADDNFASFQREHPGSKGAKMFATIRKRILSAYHDVVSIHQLSNEIRTGIRNEWGGDVFAVSAITQKAALLTNCQREAVEAIIDDVLSGKGFKVVPE